MAKEKEQTQTQETAIASRDEQREIEKSGAPEVNLSAEYLTTLAAEIQVDLKALTVDKFTPPRELLDKKLNLHDVFIMQVAGFAEPEKNDEGFRVISEVTDEDGISYSVAQNAIGSRMTMVNLYNNVRKAQQKLVLTNVYFKELGTGKFGNKPIILTLSKETQQVWN